VRVDYDRTLDTRDTGHAATGTETEPLECSTLSRTHGRQVLFALDDPNGIRAAHAHTAAGLHHYLAGLGDVEQLVADLRHHCRPRAEGNRNLPGVDGLGNAQKLVAGMSGRRFVLGHLPTLTGLHLIARAPSPTSRVW
jgi:hypothetical protein